MEPEKASTATVSGDGGGSSRRAAGLFDVRNIIAALLGIYGVVLTIMGIVNFTDADKQKSDNVNLNLWTGLALIVVAVLMALWCALRPIVVDEAEVARVREEMEHGPAH